MKRNRAYRRHQTARVQTRRWKSVYERWVRQALIDRPEWFTERWVADYKGKFRDSNGSCSCGHCNPHKIGYDKRLSVGHRRALESVKDRSQPEGIDDDRDEDADT